MSTLKTNTLTGTTSAGVINVTGEGGSTTTNLQQGLAKAWINLDGIADVTTQDSFNTGSITDNGTGDYSITITNDMNNAFYSFTFGDYLSSNNSIQVSGSADAAPATGSIRLQCVTTGNSVADITHACVTIHGDLA